MNIEADRLLAEACKALSERFFEQPARLTVESLVKCKRNSTPFVVTQTPWTEPGEPSTAFFSLDEVMRSGYFYVPVALYWKGGIRLRALMFAISDNPNLEEILRTKNTCHERLVDVSLADVVNGSTMARVYFEQAFDTDKIFVTPKSQKAWLEKFMTERIESELQILAIDCPNFGIF